MTLLPSPGGRRIALPARFAILPLALVLIATGAAAGGTWPRDHLYGAHAAEGGHQWAVGAFGTIFHSANGGVSWEAQSSGTTEGLFGVHFFNSTHGWIAGRSGVMLRTQDGGKTWTQQTTGDANHLFDITALSPDRAVAIGDWGTILLTTDGGATWQKRSLDRDVILNGQAWVDEQRGWIVGEAGLIVATTDGGSTWTEQNSGIMKTLFGVSFADAQRGWAAGLDGLILHTDNGGAEWRVVRGSADLAALEQVGAEQVAENPTLFDIAVANDIGYAVGDSGSVFASKDGGAQWQRADLPDNVRLRWIRAVALGGGGGLLVGADGLTLRVNDGRISAPETEQHAASASH